MVAFEMSKLTTTALSSPSRQGKYDKVLLATAKVLKVDENNVKAHYRRAKALMCLGDTVKAAQHLDKAFDVAPDGESNGT